MGYKVNDKIKCNGIADLIDTMYKLAKENVETDFSYEQNGEKGYWLIVTKIGRKKGDK